MHVVVAGTAESDQLSTLLSQYRETFLVHAIIDENAHDAGRFGGQRGFRG